MQTLKKYWLWFVGVVGVLVTIYLVRPRSKTSTGISELQKAEDKIRESTIERQKEAAKEVTESVSKLNESRKPETVVDQNKDMDALAEEYNKL